MSSSTSVVRVGLCSGLPLAVLLTVVGIIIAMDHSSTSAQPMQDDGETYDVPPGMRFEIEIRSERGIGRACLRPIEKAWPEELVLHLRLKGLESLTLQTTQWRVQTSVSSTDGTMRPTTLSSPQEAERDSKELEINDPRTLHVEPVEKTATQDALPPGFRIKIPAALLADSPESLEIRWIDFYR